MAEQNCTPETRTTKEKRNAVTCTLWVGGSSAFYKERPLQNLILACPVWAQLMPLPLATWEGNRHV